MSACLSRVMQEALKEALQVELEVGLQVQMPAQANVVEGEASVTRLGLAAKVTTRVTSERPGLAIALLEKGQGIG